MMSVGNSYGSLPVNTAAPVVSGTATFGSTLTTTDGTWTGAPAPTFTYQWQRGTTNISGATSSTYVVQLGDVGSTIRCVVTATNPLGAVSANSNSTGTVPAVAPGTALGGGFYAGNIVVSGTTYAVVVAPRSSGENSSRQSKTSATASPAATQTLNNGFDASASMNSSTYPAAQFCENLTIGGFTDWYLPARDELEICYRYLKPSTTNNNTSTRPKSSIAYPQGNDVSGDTTGINRNSSPTGAAYTSGNPAQTSATAFQVGGSEAFNHDPGTENRYFSSSEFSSANQWEQNFANGEQADIAKDNNRRVRAIRRIAI